MSKENEMYKEIDEYDLAEVWNGLDTAYEDIEKLLKKLSSMNGLPDELKQEVKNFDLSSILNLKQHIDTILDSIEKED